MMRHLLERPVAERDERLTVRVGCRLIYEAPAATPLLLNIQPMPEHGQVVDSEQLEVGDGLESEALVNEHDVPILRCSLPAGSTEVRHDALVRVPASPDQAGIEDAPALAPSDWPVGVVRYLRPSRYCESDRLAPFARRTFGRLKTGWPQVEAVRRWIHQHVRYRWGPSEPQVSACDVFDRRYGLSRDFAHLTVAFCRALDLPARYATGHLPEIGRADSGRPMDFQAYAEVFLGGRWYPVDARYNEPRVGRIKVSHGLDAGDCAFSTAFNPVDLTYFEVWSYQVEPGTVAVGDPVDLRKRLDGTAARRWRIWA